MSKSREENREDEFIVNEFLKKLSQAEAGIEVIFCYDYLGQNGTMNTLARDIRECSRLFGPEASGILRGLIMWHKTVIGHKHYLAIFRKLQILEGSEENSPNEESANWSENILNNLN